MLSRALQSLDLDALKSERSSCLSAVLSLASGKTVQRKTLDGRSVEYTPADIDALKSLIDSLEQAIQAKESPGHGGPIVARWG